MEGVGSDVSGEVNASDVLDVTCETQQAISGSDFGSSEPLLFQVALLLFSPHPFPLLLIGGLLVLGIEQLVPCSPVQQNCNCYPNDKT